MPANQVGTFVREGHARDNCHSAQLRHHSRSANRLYRDCSAKPIAGMARSYRKPAQHAYPATTVQFHTALHTKHIHICFLAVLVFTQCVLIKRTACYAYTSKNIASRR